LFEAPAGDPDDLKKITGVGPSLERKLRELGVTKLDQIANLSDEDMEKIDAALNSKGRIQRDDWVGQARALVSGA
jgi:predicted flap endonuclease-1-like 5' DNA nuclease